MTSVIAHVIIAIELDDCDAAVQLLPMIERSRVELRRCWPLRRCGSAPSGEPRKEAVSIFRHPRDEHQHVRQARVRGTSHGIGSADCSGAPAQGHCPERRSPHSVSCKRAPHFDESMP